MTKEKADELVNSFEPHLSSYIKHRGLINESHGLSALKGAILILVENHKARNEYPDLAIVAVAGVISYIYLHKNPQLGEKGKSQQEAITDSAEWLKKEFLTLNRKVVLEGDASNYLILEMMEAYLG